MPSALNMRLRSSARAGYLWMNRAQHRSKLRALSTKTAVKELTEYPFDALFFSGFTSAYDAQCALMGARAVADGPVFLSYALTDAGELPTHTHTLAEAVALADEYGADVIGIASGATYEHLAPAIEILRENTTKPLLAELVVRELIERAYDCQTWIIPIIHPTACSTQRSNCVSKVFNSCVQEEWQRSRIPVGWSLP